MTTDNIITTGPVITVTWWQMNGSCLKTLPNGYRVFSFYYVC